MFFVFHLKILRKGAVINYFFFGGGGGVLFQKWGPKILAPLRLTAQKICPLQKCVPGRGEVTLLFSS